MTILDNKGIYYKKASIYGSAEYGKGYKRPTNTLKYRR